MSAPLAFLVAAGAGAETLIGVAADARAAGWHVLAGNLRASSRVELLERVRREVRDVRALRAVLPLHPSIARQVRLAEWMLALSWRALRAVGSPS